MLRSGICGCWSDWPHSIIRAVKKFIRVVWILHTDSACYAAGIDHRERNRSKLFRTTTGSLGMQFGRRRRPACTGCPDSLMHHIRCRRRVRTLGSVSGKRRAGRVAYIDGNIHCRCVMEFEVVLWLVLHESAVRHAPDVLGPGLCGGVRAVRFETCLNEWSRRRKELPDQDDLLAGRQNSNDA
jgi:hypothetical protein